jgi:hypothetical protein
MKRFFSLEALQLFDVNPILRTSGVHGAGSDEVLAGPASWCQREQARAVWQRTAFESSCNRAARQAV